MKQTSEQVRQQAEAWVAKNPEMWREFKGEAVMLSAQKQQWSARGIAERLRWDGRYEREYGAQFKIPNAITPVLGRMVVETHPFTEPFFRRSTSKVDA